MRPQSTLKAFVFGLAAAWSTVAGAQIPKPSDKAIWAKDLQTFTAIDQAVDALKVPDHATVSEIADALQRVSPTRMGRARAVFDWVATHMSYECDAVARGFFERDPEKLAATLRSDCGGFARLFSSIANKMGVEAIDIGGNLRTFGDPDPLFRSASHPLAPGQWLESHVWNAVRIGDRWGLVDCTAAATHTIRDGKATGGGPIHYEFFLSNPAIFATSYVPRDSQWQLLETPLSAQALQGLPIVAPIASSMGVAIEDLASTEQASGELRQILIRRLKVLGATSNFVKDGHQWDGRSLCEVSDAGTSLLVAPVPGDADVNLWLPAKGDKHVVIATYPVSGKTTSQPLPVAFVKFTQIAAHLITPLSSAVDSTTETEFRLTVPGAVATALLIDNKPYPLQQDGDTFFIRGRVPPGQIIVAAQFPGSTFWWGLLTYKGT